MKFSGQQYFEGILNSLADMNAKLATRAYHVVSDNGIEENFLETRPLKPERPVTLSQHWWGIKYQSFGHNETVDLKTMFLDNALIFGAIGTAIGLSPAAVFINVSTF